MPVSELVDKLLNAPTLLAIVNAAIGFTMCVLDLMYYRTTEEPWKWIKLAYAVIGLYWGCLYLWVLAVNLFDVPSDTVMFGRVFVRPAITITLGVMLAGAIIRHRKPK